MTAPKLWLWRWLLVRWHADEQPRLVVALRRPAVAVVCFTRENGKGPQASFGTRDGLMLSVGFPLEWPARTHAGRVAAGPVALIYWPWMDAAEVSP